VRCKEHDKQNISREFYQNRPDGTSGKTFVSGARGMGSNPEPIKSPTRCHQLATVAATLMCGPVAKPRSWDRYSWHSKGY